MRAYPYPSQDINVRGPYLHHLQEIWYIRESVRFRYIQGERGLPCMNGTYEARICSISRQPDYLIRDHFEYLSVDFASCIMEDFFKGLVPLWSQLLSELTTPNPDRPWLMGVWGPTPEWWPAWLPKPKPVGGEPAGGWPWNPNNNLRDDLDIYDEEEEFYAGLAVQSLNVTGSLQKEGEFGNEALNILLKSFTRRDEAEEESFGTWAM